MSWQIVETEIVGGQTRAFFWCDTSGCAFGPMMVDREAAEEVARRAGGDPRAVSLDALDHLYAGLIDEREYDPDPAPQPGEGGGEPGVMQTKPDAPLPDDCTCRGVVRTPEGGLLVVASETWCPVHKVRRADRPSSTEGLEEEIEAIERDLYQPDGPGTKWECVNCGTKAKKKRRVHHHRGCPGRLIRRLQAHDRRGGRG